MANFSAINFEVPTFTSLLRFNGGELPHEPGAMALWWYYVQARRNWEAQQTPVVLEGDADPQYNYKQLYLATGLLYGVEPEVMQRYWSVVDKQALVLGLPLLQNALRFQGIQVS